MERILICEKKTDGTYGCGDLIILINLLGAEMTSMTSLFIGVCNIFFVQFIQKDAMVNGTESTIFMVKMSTTKGR